MEKEIRTALLIVDFQNEFLDGKIHLPYSSSIIEKINKYQSKFDIVCFIKNIFPKMDKVKSKVLISDTGHYCNDETKGSEFPENLKTNDNIFIRNYDLSFSALSGVKDGEKLIDFLRNDNITHVFICGLPGDYSIKYTALESIDNFKTYIVIDMVKTINGIDNFVKYLVSRKIPFINTGDIDLVLDGLKSKPGSKKERKKEKKDESWDWMDSKYQPYTPPKTRARRV